MPIAIAWRTLTSLRFGLVPLNVKWRKSGPPATRTTPFLAAAARFYELGSLGIRLTSTSPLTNALTPASPSSARVMMRSSFGLAPHQFGSGTSEYWRMAPQAPASTPQHAADDRRDEQQPQAHADAAAELLVDRVAVDGLSEVAVHDARD